MPHGRKILGLCVSFYFVHNRTLHIFKENSSEHIFAHKPAYGLAHRYISKASSRVDKISLLAYLVVIMGLNTVSMEKQQHHQVTTLCEEVV